MSFTSRKFIIALVALGLGAWMRFKGVLADESTLNLMMAAVLGYQGGNVAHRAVDAAVAKLGTGKPAE